MFHYVMLQSAERGKKERKKKKSSHTGREFDRGKYQEGRKNEIVAGDKSVDLEVKRLFFISQSLFKSNNYHVFTAFLFKAVLGSGTLSAQKGSMM